MFTVNKMCTFIKLVKITNLETDWSVCYTAARHSDAVTNWCFLQVKKQMNVSHLVPDFHKEALTIKNLSYKFETKLSQVSLHSAALKIAWFARGSGGYCGY